MTMLALAPVLLYLFLLGAQAYSAWQAARMLDRLEALRIGSPAADFERAVQACEGGALGDDEEYVFSSAALRFENRWKLLYRMPEKQYVLVYQLLNRLGLRFWYFTIYASHREGRLTLVSANLLLDGHAQMLGGNWKLSDRLRSAERPAAWIHGNHITSFPRSGQAMTIDLTAQSSEAETATRRINRRCLLSFHGCEDICELLPEAARLWNWECAGAVQYRRQGVVESRSDDRK